MLFRVSWSSRKVFRVALYVYVKGHFVLQIIFSARGLQPQMEKEPDTADKPEDAPGSLHAAFSLCSSNPGLHPQGQDTDAVGSWHPDSHHSHRPMASNLCWCGWAMAASEPLGGILGLIGCISSCLPPMWSEALGLKVSVSKQFGSIKINILRFASSYLRSSGCILGFIGGIGLLPFRGGRFCADEKMRIRHRNSWGYPRAHWPHRPPDPNVVGGFASM